jgi:hypothetical protein
MFLPLCMPMQHKAGNSHQQMCCLETIIRRPLSQPARSEGQLPAMMDYNIRDGHTYLYSNETHLFIWIWFELIANSLYPTCNSSSG